MYFIFHTFYAAYPVLQVLTFLHSDLQGGKLVQAISAFFGGFIIAFTKGWLLTLVMLTSLPLVALAGAVSTQLLTRVSSKRLTSYSDAADTVEQTIGSIRTVSSNYISHSKLYQLSQLIQMIANINLATLV